MVRFYDFFVFGYYLDNAGSPRYRHYFVKSQPSPDHVRDYMEHCYSGFHVTVIVPAYLFSVGV